MLYTCPLCASKGILNQLISYKVDQDGRTMDLCQDETCTYPMNYGSCLDYINQPQPKEEQNCRVFSPKTSISFVSNPKKPRRDKFFSKECRKSLVRHPNSEISSKNNENVNRIDEISNISSKNSVFDSNLITMAEIKVNSWLKSCESNDSGLALSSPTSYVPQNDILDTKINTFGRFMDKIHVFWCQMDGQSWVDSFFDTFVQNSEIFRLVMTDSLMTKRLPPMEDGPQDILKTFFGFVEHFLLRIEAGRSVRKLLAYVCSDYCLFETFGHSPDVLLSKLRNILDKIVTFEEFQDIQRKLLKSKKNVISCVNLTFDGDMNCLEMMRSLIGQSTNLADGLLFEADRRLFCQKCGHVNSQRIKKSLLELQGVVNFDLSTAMLESTSFCVDCSWKASVEHKILRLNSLLVIYASGGFKEFDLNKPLHLQVSEGSPSVYVISSLIGYDLKSGLALSWYRDFAENSWMPSIWPEISLSAHVYKNPMIHASCIRFLVYRRLDGLSVGCDSFVAGSESVCDGSTCVSERDSRISFLRNLRSRKQLF